MNERKKGFVVPLSAVSASIEVFDSGRATISLSMPKEMLERIKDDLLEVASQELPFDKEIIMHKDDFKVEGTKTLRLTANPQYIPCPRDHSKSMRYAGFERKPHINYESNPFLDSAYKNRLMDEIHQTLLNRIVRGEEMAGVTTSPEVNPWLNKSALDTGIAINTWYDELTSRADMEHKFRQRLLFGSWAPDMDFSKLEERVLANHLNDEDEHDGDLDNPYGCESSS